MVDKIFLIKGKNIFDIGFRPALIQLADEAGIKAHATNLRDKERVRVVASGSYASVESYYKTIVDKRLPATFGGTPKYTVGEIKDYDGPDIDWSGYNQQFMAAQLAKSVEFFNYLDKKIDAMHNDIKNNKMTKRPTK